MNLLLFAKEYDEAGKKIQESIDELMPGHPAEVHKTIESLCCRLRQPDGEMSIAIISTKTGKDLREILSVRDLLFDLLIILVIPNNEEQMFSEGLTLRPRFLAFSDGNLREIPAVVERILRSYSGKLHR